MDTENFGFKLIDKVSDLGDFYNSDISLIDRILKVLSGANDGSSVTVDTPSVSLTGASNPGGDLPSGTTYWYEYTFVDPSTGLESSPSPVFEISTNSYIESPNAPTFDVSYSGGSLTSGKYNYVLSKYYTTNSFETAALNESSVVLYSVNGDSQKVTLTLPALGDATGFNVYRRTPGNVSFYYIGSTAGTTFEDTGLPPDVERRAPVTGNIVSDSAIDLTLASLPAGYHWKIYRTDVEEDFTNSYIATVTDGSLTFTDTGFETQYGTPPSVTPVLVPSNVGLRSGSGAPSSGDGNVGDWYINTDTNDFYGPKAVDNSWPGPISLGASYNGDSIGVPNVDGIADIGSAVKSSAYLVIWEDGLTVKLPPHSTYDPFTLIVSNIEGGLISNLNFSTAEGESLAWPGLSSITPNFVPVSGEIGYTFLRMPDLEGFPSGWFGSVINRSSYGASPPVDLTSSSWPISCDLIGFMGSATSILLPAPSGLPVDDVLTLTLPDPSVGPIFSIRFVSDGYMDEIDIVASGSDQANPESDPFEVRVTHSHVHELFLRTDDQGDGYKIWRSLWIPREMPKVIKVSDLVSFRSDVVAASSFEDLQTALVTFIDLVSA